MRLLVIFASHPVATEASWPCVSHINSARPSNKGNTRYTSVRRVVPPARKHPPQLCNIKKKKNWRHNDVRACTTCSQNFTVKSCSPHVRRHIHHFQNLLPLCNLRLNLYVQLNTFTKNSLDIVHAHFADLPSTASCTCERHTSPMICFFLKKKFLIGSKTKAPLTTRFNPHSLMNF